MAKKENKAIVDMGQLEIPIKEIESIMADYNALDKGIIMQQIQTRIMLQRQKEHAVEVGNSYVNKLIPKSIQDMLRKDKQKEDDEDVD